MTMNDVAAKEPPRARKSPHDEAEPQSLLERQSGLTTYLMRRAKHRREMFLRRAAAFSLRKELSRNGYLAVCLLIDLLVIPELLVVLPLWWGWALFAGVLGVALWAEFRVYGALFALPESAEVEL